MTPLIGAVTFVPTAISAFSRSSSAFFSSISTFLTRCISCRSSRFVSATNCTRTFFAAASASESSIWSACCCLARSSFSEIMPFWRNVLYEATSSFSRSRSTPYLDTCSSIAVTWRLVVSSVCSICLRWASFKIARLFSRCLSSDSAFWMRTASSFCSMTTMVAPALTLSPGWTSTSVTGPAVTVATAKFPSRSAMTTPLPYTRVGTVPNTAQTRAATTRTVVEKASSRMAGGMTLMRWLRCSDDLTGLDSVPPDLAAFRLSGPGFGVERPVAPSISKENVLYVFAR